MHARTTTLGSAQRFRWTADMPVEVIGCGERPKALTMWRKEFANLAEARKEFPELDPARGSEGFTGAMRGEDEAGNECIRFETCEVFEMLSS